MFDLEKNLDNNTINNNCVLYLPVSKKWSEMKRLTVANMQYLAKVISNNDDKDLYQLLNWAVYDKSILKYISEYDLPFIWSQVIFNNFLKPIQLNCKCSACNNTNQIMLTDRFLGLFDDRPYLYSNIENDDIVLKIGPQKVNLKESIKYTSDWYRSYIYDISIGGECIDFLSLDDTKQDAILNYIQVYNFKFDIEDKNVEVSLPCKCGHSIKLEYTADFAKDTMKQVITESGKVLIDVYLDIKDIIPLDYINTLPYIDFQVLIMKLKEKQEAEHKNKGTK